MKRLAYVFILVLGVLLITNCFQEKFITESGASIQISTDTLTFDTVFTTVGSATRSFRIINPHNLPIRLSRIALDAGTQSRFRMNIDGISYPDGVAEEVEIWANDSIWVFIEVTVDPDQSVSESPFVISENLSIQVNGNNENVIVDAWGQNANYIPNNMHGGRLALLTCDLNEVVWDDPKPYVIYGLLLIDSCSLIIPEGTQIHIHGGIANNDLGIYDDGILWVLRNGKLIVEGTRQNPVIFQGDRLEEPYWDQEGQWAGIRIGAGSQGNSMTHTHIKNSIVGVRVDSAATLDIDQCRIYNTASSGLIGIHSKINAQNSLIYNTNGIGVVLRYGGTYNFDYITVATYGNGNESVYLDNFFCYNEDCSIGNIFSLNARMRNCIFSGSDTDEIQLVDASGPQDLFKFEVDFQNCLVRVDELLDDNRFPNFFNLCDPCVRNEQFDDLIFENIDMNDYHLDSLSIAEGMARPLPGLTTDLDGVERDPIMPDIGCYERQ